MREGPDPDGSNNNSTRRCALFRSAGLFAEPLQAEFQPRIDIIVGRAVPIVLFMDSSKRTADFQIFVSQCCQGGLNVSEDGIAIRHAVFWKPFYQRQSRRLWYTKPRQFGSQFNGESLSGSFADPLGFTEPSEVSSGDRTDEVCVSAFLKEGQGSLWADAIHSDQSPKELPLVFVVKAEENTGVFSLNVMSPENQIISFLQLALLALGDLYFVANSCTIQNNTGLRPLRPCVQDRSLQPPDHEACVRSLHRA